MGIGRGASYGAWSPPVSDQELGFEVARDAAFAFVIGRGDALESVRARSLMGELPPAAVPEALVERGAFEVSGGEALRPALVALDQIDQLDAPVLEPVVQGLAQVHAGLAVEG